MSAYMANAFANMSNSFLSSYKETVAEEERKRRQAEEDAWTRENRARQRKSWEREDAADAAIGAAMAPATRSEGFRITDQAGSDAYTKDADAAAVMQDMAGSKNEGAVSRSAFRVADKTYDSAGEAAAAEDKYNSPYQQMNRAADAVAGIDPSRSQKLRSDAMQTRANEITLSKAEQEEVKERFNMSLFEEIDGAPTWHEGAAQFGTKMLGGKGRVESRLAPDGKSVTLVAVMDDGTEKVTGTYEDSPKGFEEFVNKAAKLDTKSKLGILAFRANLLREEEAAKTARENQIADRQAEFDNRVALSDRQHAQAMARQRASQAVPRDREGSPMTAVDPATGQAVQGRMVNGKFTPYDMGGFSMQQRQVDPEKYTSVLKNNLEIYQGDAAKARLVTDEMFGLRGKSGPAGAPAGDAALAQMNADRAKAAQGAQPARAQPQPQARPTVEQAMNPGGNDALGRVMAAKVQQVSQLAEQYKQAQAMTAAAAKSQDPAAVTHYARQQQQVEQAIKQQLSGMNPQQAAQVLSSLGL